MPFDNTISSLDKFVDSRDYSILNGTWYLYWISFDSKYPSHPIWCHGICEFHVFQNKVEGYVKLINHPYGDAHFIQRGEIRNNKLYLFDVCVEDNSEFSSIIYPNLENNDLFVGIWNGFDNINRPIAGPNVMSRKPLDEDQLNLIVPNKKFILIE